MALPKLTYEDFKTRISIQEVLQDAGYHLYRKDGLRHPSYVRTGSDGRRVSGDKFIVSGNGNCCFRPPERKNYNIISFIKEHPHFFADYKPGMSLDRLVNVVCHRLLNQPLEERQAKIFTSEHKTPSFTLTDYEIDGTNAHIAKFLLARGIGRDVQDVFSKFMRITCKKNEDGKKRYQNLSFPLQIPGKPAWVGMEERGFPNKDGSSSYKGLAKGSDAAHGLWIANLGEKPLVDAKDIYWFESAFDAMAFYKLQHNKLDFSEAVLVSTSGSPTQEQFKGMFGAAPDASHHLCFDNDRAGQMFAVNFALTKTDRNFKTSILEDDILKIEDQRGVHQFDMSQFDFADICSQLKIYEASPYDPNLQEYVDSLFNEDDIYSGNPIYLTADCARTYKYYEAKCEELHCARSSGLVSPDDLEDIRKEAVAAREDYLASIKKEFTVWPPFEKKIFYTPCDSLYKDWNDQLRDIPIIKADVSQEHKNGLKR